jgi:hypothetical protein
MTIVNIPRELSSVRHAEGTIVMLGRAVGELDDGLRRTVDVVALLEQERVSEMIW